MITALIGTVVALFGYIAIHRLAFWRERHARRVTACIAFRSAVLAELGSIYPNATAWPDNIDAFLRDRSTALQTAVENFSPFVPWWQKWFFNRAWRLYIKGKCGVRGQHQNYWQYVPHGSTDEKGHPHDNHLTYKQDFKRNVGRLLSYAKET